MPLFQILHSLKLLDSKQNKNENRPTVWSAQPVLRSNHFSISDRCNLDLFSMERSRIFWSGSEKVKKKVSSLIWLKVFLRYWISHDAATTSFNRWLWHWLNAFFSLNLSKSADRPFMRPESLSTTVINN